MTPEEQNIAIAEACGWRRCPDMSAPCGRWHSPDNQRYEVIPPDYINDLNAMASAENYAQNILMNADQWEKYGRLLYDAHPTAVLADGNGTIDFFAVAELITSLTARQRAEAFCRVMWPERWKQ